jgi:hypothetical protein
MAGPLSCQATEQNIIPDDKIEHQVGQPPASQFYSQIKDLMLPIAADAATAPVWILGLLFIL